jgi:hypothetical protein
MLKTVNKFTIITCDKCGRSDSARKDISNRSFFLNGWGLNPRAKKYTHLCYRCQPKKHRESHEFVVNNFL